MRLGKDDYKGLHQRYAEILKLAAEEENETEDEVEFPTLESGWMLLMGWLYQQAEVSPESLTAKEVQRFIRTHTDVLDGAVDTVLKEVPLDDTSVQRLKESNYVFSGIKTFHELNEAFPSLLDEEGNRKPFNQFLNDVQKVYDAYNVQYLRTEYNFAQASALMAARWKQFEQEGDRYYLQYRTVGDKRVRRTHRMLHNITLPIESPFWDKYFPPNGWNCRCTVVQVRKDKYPVSNEQEAMNLGSQATAGKYQEMFMFNPGKRMIQDATAAMRVQGDSMSPEYKSGSIVALRQINDQRIIMYGEDYVVETDEIRVIKRLQRADDPAYLMACSVNQDQWESGPMKGHLIHEPFEIPRSSIRRLFLVLGEVRRNHSCNIIDVVK